MRLAHVTGAGRRLLLLGLALVLAPIVLSAQTVSSDPLEPWDFAIDAPPRASDRSPKPVVDGLLQVYRRSSGERTVDRCIFHTSCSAFFEQAVYNHGILLGTIMFIDRNMYRENADAYALYTLHFRPDGVIEVGDDYYLE